MKDQPAIFWFVSNRATEAQSAWWNQDKAPSNPAMSVSRIWRYQDGSNSAMTLAETERLSGCRNCIAPNKQLLTDGAKYPALALAVVTAASEINI